MAKANCPGGTIRGSTAMTAAVHRSGAGRLLAFTVQNDITRRRLCKTAFSWSYCAAASTADLRSEAPHMPSQSKSPRIVAAGNLEWRCNDEFSVFCLLASCRLQLHSTHAVYAVPKCEARELS